MYSSQLRNWASTRSNALQLSVRKPMPPHKFKIGEVVFLKPAISRNVPGGVFEVIKHLPGTSEPEYRIKSANEPHERVALESELNRA